MVTLLGKANNDLWDAGWTQKEIDLVLFGTTRDLRETEFKGR